MNPQKDIHKTSANSYGHSNVSNDNTKDNKGLYEFAHKKTEKLVTALYMVTDCMDADDALKGKLRHLGVGLLSDMHSLSILSPVEKHASITVALSRIGEILSFVQIAHTIGFVSEMNGSILKKEFHLLTAELKSYLTENQNASRSTSETRFGPRSVFENKKSASFELDETMFSVDTEHHKIATIAHSHDEAKNNLKDSKPAFSMSFKSKDMLPKFSPLKGLTSGKQTFNIIGPSKEERKTKILALIKDKKEVSIKDISSAFLDCSEKTIQRELNDLVSKGQIRKIGEKRWSRYAVLSN